MPKNKPEKGVLKSVRRRREKKSPEYKGETPRKAQSQLQLYFLELGAPWLLPYADGEEHKTQGLADILDGYEMWKKKRGIPQASTQAAQSISVIEEANSQWPEDQSKWERILPDEYTLAQAPPEDVKIYKEYLTQNGYYATSDATPLPTGDTPPSTPVGSKPGTGEWIGSPSPKHINLDLFKTPYKEAAEAQADYIYDKLVADYGKKDPKDLDDEDQLMLQVARLKSPDAYKKFIRDSPQIKDLIPDIPMPDLERWNPVDEETAIQLELEYQRTPFSKQPAFLKQHAKNPTESAHNDNQGENSDPMLPNTQPFKRVSATGRGPFVPRISQEEEPERDEGDRDPTDELAPRLKQGGDTTTDNEPAEATLRSSFQLDPLANEVVPAPDKQIQSDVLFDMFSVVQPGFGKGVDNKLVYENEARENAIQFKEPMYLPRFEHGSADIGIAQHVNPLQWQFQPHGVGAQIAAHVKQLDAMRSDMNALLEKATAVGADPRTLPGVSNHHPSSQGLPRQQLNVLQPVIDNRSRWNPVIEAPGFALNKRGYRHLHSPWMQPFHAEHDPMNSGPHLKKRRSLEVILP